MAAYTTIDNPEAHYQTQLYTGNGAANHAITLGGDTAMQPDLVWIKNRDAADSHCIFDSLRGATYVIDSNSTAASVADTDTLDSFTSDGFQVDADVKVNTNTEKYVAWCWKGGTTSGITTNGSTTITPDAYSFNQTAGFSILKFEGNYTSGAKVAHGLGVAPELIIIKDIESVANWGLFYKPLGNTKSYKFTTAAPVDSTAYWNDTDPDSVNFTLGDNTDVNPNGNDAIAYCFASIQGYSKVGSYIGNQNTNGTFVYTGFRPAYVTVRKDATGEYWYTSDSKRLGFNDKNHHSYLNDPGAEGGSAGGFIDLLSNGFKLRTVSGSWNGSGSTMYYFAFAEQPFVNSEGVPCNAR